MPGPLDYSTTAGSNTTVGGVNIAEGMQAGLMNNALRAAMADTRKWQLDWSGIVTAGAGNAYTITSNQGVTSYTDGLRVSFRADRNNTGAATLNVDSRGAKALRKVSGGALVAVAADDIVADAVYDVVYVLSADVFVLLGSGGLAGVTASAAELNILDGATLTTTELNYVDGVTSAIQTQLNAKANAAGTQTIWLPAGSFTPTTTNGASYASQELATNDVMVAGYDFSAGTDQKVQTMIAMPKSWNESTVTAQIFWKDATTAGTGDVIWGVQALAVGNDDAMDAAFGTAQTVTDTFIASGDLHITSVTSAITAAGSPAEGDLLIVQVYRDADAGGDTYTQQARLIGVKLLYTTNAGDDS
jgi:hypothetical protein